MLRKHLLVQDRVVEAEMNKPYMAQWERKRALSSSDSDFKSACSLLAVIQWGDESQNSFPPFEI